MSLEYSIVRVNKDNLFMFDNMAFYRKHGREKSEMELKENQDFNSYYTTYCNALEVQTFYVFAVQLEEKFIGYIFINYLPKIGVQNNNGHLYIEDLWTHPNYRRMGIAQSLMKKAEDLAKEKNIYGLRLGVNSTNEAAIALYEKCGYESMFGTGMTMQKVVLCE